MKAFTILLTFSVGIVGTLGQYGAPQQQQAYGAPGGASQFGGSGGIGQGGGSGGQEAARVFRFVSVHVPPAETEVRRPQRPRVINAGGAGPRDKHYNIIFIRAPIPPPPQQTEVILGEQPEKKTLVYVLVRKPEEGRPEDNIKITHPKPVKPAQPEVYFVSYKNTAGGGGQSGASNGNGGENGNVGSSGNGNGGNGYGAPGQGQGQEQVYNFPNDAGNGYGAPGQGQGQEQVYNFPSDAGNGNGGNSVSGPGGSYGAPVAEQAGEPRGNYGAPVFAPGGNYGAPASAPGGNYGAPASGANFLGPAQGSFSGGGYNRRSDIEESPYLMSGAQ